MLQALLVSVYFSVEIKQLTMLQALLVVADFNVDIMIIMILLIMIIRLRNILKVLFQRHRDVFRSFLSSLGVPNVYVCVYMNVHIYIYIYIMYIHIHTYIYIYVLYMCVYIYIYIYKDNYSIYCSPYALAWVVCRGTFFGGTHDCRPSIMILIMI